ncbi:hypothetical protein ACFWAY_52215 [Rhodococcus sp. NPDC059968]|uniref:hypothetical protein n=1 Tax=Rhodococcus sp. NPDC059968 TaxID=3347017 RepID=UPI00366BE09E
MTQHATRRIRGALSPEFCYPIGVSLGLTICLLLGNFAARFAREYNTDAHRHAGEAYTVSAGRAGMTTVIDMASTFIRDLIASFRGQYGVIDESFPGPGPAMQFSDAEREFIVDEWLRQQAW